MTLASDASFLVLIRFQRKRIWRLHQFFGCGVVFLFQVKELEANYLLKVTNVQSQKKKKKKRNNPTNSNTNYRREMKLVPIIVDYCLLQFGTSNFFLRVRLHGVSLSNFNFFNVRLQI